MKRFIICSLIFSLNVSAVFAQIRISPIKVDEWVKNNFSGQGVVVGNISSKGYPLSILSFTSTGNVLQVPKGLVLSTGNSYNVAGYNNSHNQSSTFTDISKNQQDEDLSAYIKEKLYDVCSIEFDFVPMDNSIQFSYQFGSDEYPEYVGSAYNDIFAFIISDGETKRNIALVPDTQIPVSINTINHKLNTEYYIDNNLFTQVLIKRQQPAKSTYKGTLPGRVLRTISSIFRYQDSPKGDQVLIKPDPELIKTRDPNLYRNMRYDGITKKMYAQAYVTPYKKYRLKIIIADVSDNIYDSGVFIEDRSLTSKKDVDQPGFVDYPNLTNVIDPKLILEGKTLEEIMPADYKPTVVASPGTNYIPLRDPAPITGQERPVRVSDQPRSETIPALENVVVNFDFDKSEVKPDEMAKLRAAILKYQSLRNHYTFELRGHTDSIGSMDYNIALSERRNQSVREAIRQILGEAPKVTRAALSFKEPVASNTTDEGRHENRRVEVIFKRK